MDLKMYEVPRWIFLNLEKTFLLHKTKFQLPTVSSLNIPITWTNFTYERFPILEQFKKWTHSHLEIFLKMDRLPRWTVSNLKQILKKMNGFSKRHEQISIMNKLQTWMVSFFKQFSKMNGFHRLVTWMDFHDEQISSMNGFRL
jgi:hypothetical protein